MIHYVVNISICWLVCLAYFELVLRKEQFHQHNRIYLLGSLVVGCLLPLIHLNLESKNIESNFNMPLSQLYQAKKVLNTEAINKITAQPINGQVNIEYLIWAIYLIGVVVSLILTGKEILYMIQLYRNGNRIKQGRFIIIQTSKEHAPFSFFNFIFVRSRLDYNQTQWDLLLHHEKEHGRQLHSLDNIVLLFIRTLNWFNPLVYIYTKRIRMVHEFQADMAAGNDIEVYGAFLIEQNFLKSAPQIAHSFNYSPLKTRINMLANNTKTRLRVLKFLSVLPLILLLVIFCTQTAFVSQDDHRDMKVKFKENTIEFGMFKIIPYPYRDIFIQQKKAFFNFELPDSVSVVDKVTGLVKMIQVERDTMPVKLNGVAILGNEESYIQSDYATNYTSPKLVGNFKTIEEFIFDKLQSEFDKLGDGGYYLNLNRIVLNSEGRIAYYENHGLEITEGPFDHMTPLSLDVKKAIENRISAILDEEVKFKPAMKDGKPVNVRMMLSNHLIQVKNHKAKLAVGIGC